MIASFWDIWNTAQPVLAGLKAGEWAVLSVLGASLLVLSSLRERYLLIWTAGWGLLAGSLLTGVHGAVMGMPERYVRRSSKRRSWLRWACWRARYWFISGTGICWRRWL